MYCIATSDGAITSVTQITDPSQCPVLAGTFVALEPSDVPANPFVMSNEAGLMVSGAIATLWCIAWGVRAVRLAL
ncbi:hypothetical protein ACG04R_00940 [Roseateles sp. BYS78W]|uniref:IPTL-CTERM protein sorting domain-containing protein n=1 Tax=Pelomonas candidula TaxID=3299025 RepID=A0ABW7H6P2_9BURK